MILSMIMCLQKIRQIARLLSELLLTMTIFKSLHFEIIDGAAVVMNLECLFKFQVLYLRICTVIFFHDLQNKDLFYEKNFCQLFICKYISSDVQNFADFKEEKQDSNNDSFDDYVPTENSSNRTVIVRAAPDDDDIQELTL